MEKQSFLELVPSEELYEAYACFLDGKEAELREDFSEFERWYTRDFLKGTEKGKTDKKVLVQGERLRIREAHLEDSDFMSSVEQDPDNSPWVANWPLGWRVAKFGDAGSL